MASVAFALSGTPEGTPPVACLGGGGIMKEHKQVSQGPAEQMAARPGATDKNGAAQIGEHKSVRTTMTGQKPLRPGFTMQSEVQTRRGRGRLSREAMVKLGR